MLDPSDRAEAEEFLTAHSPRTHGQPFAREGQRWVAVREPATGALLAASGAANRARPAPRPWRASPWRRTAAGRGGGRR